MPYSSWTLKVCCYKTFMQIIIGEFGNMPLLKNKWIKIKVEWHYFYCVPHNLLTRCFSDDAQSVELTQFKEQFKTHLTELMKPVSTTSTWLTNTILQLCNLQIILKVHAWYIYFLGVTESKEAHRWGRVDPDCMGRELLSAKPPQTNIRSSPSSDSLCLCDKPEFKAETSIISGKKRVWYVCKVLP